RAGISLPEGISAAADIVNLRYKSCPEMAGQDQLASLGIFFVYAAYCGLTYFIPFLKDIYMLPVALVGAYGIINQYALKMVGGPIGGMLADKVAKSPTVYLKWTFLISAVAMLVFMQLPHQTMNVYIGMAATLGFGAIIFSQRAIFFAPMDEIGTPREYAGSAMAFGCIIGYMPAMFAYTLYGYLLDTNSGITGYNYVFSVMIAFSLMGFICSTILVKRIKNQKLAAAAAAA
ncbi:MAG: MFS transporter, partial [Citrobacter freundii]|nr:MFS transporter [Citrobacter freundii]